MIKHWLVIEDTEKHAKEAFDAISEGGWFHYSAATLDHFLQTLGVVLGEAPIDEVGVMTDLYFLARFEDVIQERVTGELAPLGMVVMAICREKGIPCVIVTAGHHHGPKYNEVCMAGRALGWPEMIDGGEEAQKGEVTHKNWRAGIEELERQAGRSS